MNNTNPLIEKNPLKSIQSWWCGLMTYPSLCFFHDSVFCVSLPSALFLELELTGVTLTQGNCHLLSLSFSLCSPFPSHMLSLSVFHLPASFLFLLLTFLNGLNFFLDKRRDKLY